jgi:hypothetical protein
MVPICWSPSATDSAAIRPRLSSEASPVRFSNRATTTRLGSSLGAGFRSDDHSATPATTTTAAAPIATTTPFEIPGLAVTTAAWPDARLAVGAGACVSDSPAAWLVALPDSESRFKRLRSTRMSLADW